MASFFFPVPSRQQGASTSSILELQSDCGRRSESASAGSALKNSLTAATSPSSSVDYDNSGEEEINEIILNKLRTQSHLDSNDNLSYSGVLSEIDYQRTPRTCDLSSKIDALASKWISMASASTSSAIAHKEEVDEEGFEVSLDGSMDRSTSRTSIVMSGMSSRRPIISGPGSLRLVDGHGDGERFLGRPNFLTPTAVEVARRVTTHRNFESGTSKTLERSTPDRVDNPRDREHLQQPKPAASDLQSFSGRKKSAVSVISKALCFQKSDKAKTQQRKSEHKSPSLRGGGGGGGGTCSRNAKGSASTLLGRSSTRMTPADNILIDDNEAEKVEVAQQQQQAALWKTAVDPKSGRTYWYHAVTRETQWRKPLCCATPVERREAATKEQQTRDFFAGMEANILRSLASGAFAAPAPGGAAHEKKPRAQSMCEVSSSLAGAKSVARARAADDSLEALKPRALVRTISSMEASVLAALIQRVPSFRQVGSSSSDDDENRDFRPLLLDAKAASTRNESTLLLSPIPETSQQRTRSTMVDETSASSSSEDESTEKKQVVEREDSLNLASLMAASQRQKSLSNSFNLSALMRLNSDTSIGASSARGGFNTFATSAIPEEDDEDSSHSCPDNGIPSLDLRDTVGLVRETGSINFARSGFLASDEDDDDDDIVGRAGFTRMDGSLSLQAGEREIDTTPMAREDSIQLSALVSSRRVGHETSLSASAFQNGFRREPSWGSYLSESAIQGLSSEEGEAMVELAAITQQMADILPSSSSSASSADSLDGLNIQLETSDINSNFDQTNPRSALAKSSGADFSNNGNTLVATRNVSAVERTEARPSIVRPRSLREGTTNKYDKAMDKPGMLRRNTCGTLYVGSTMSAPDKDATIRCVCAVYRAHILQSALDDDEEEDAPPAEQYRLFHDSDRNGKDRIGSFDSTPTPAPSLEDITHFYRDVFGRAQMESDCIIMSLIYVERLVKVTEGALRPRTTNWRSILFSCMVMSSKVWDDLSMWNADFSQACPAGVVFSLQRVNELELAVLSALQYEVKVPASEYAKYYFLLRSMLIKSGLGSEDLTTMNPLDVEGAKQLEHVSSQYQASVASMSDLQKAATNRCKSAGTNASSFREGRKGASIASSIPEHRSKVGLEHVVHM